MACCTSRSSAKLVTSSRALLALRVLRERTIPLLEPRLVLIALLVPTIPSWAARLLLPASHVPQAAIQTRLLSEEPLHARRVDLVSSLQLLLSSAHLANQADTRMSDPLRVFLARLVA